MKDGYINAHRPFLILIIFTLLAFIAFTLYGNEYWYRRFSLEVNAPMYTGVNVVQENSSPNLTGQNALDVNMGNNINIHRSNGISLLHDHALSEITANGSSRYDMLLVDAKPYIFSSVFKTILLWTNSNKKRNWWKMKKYGHNPFIDGKCEVDACFLTNNKSHIKQADFVMFHYNESPDWPSERFPHQSYVHAMKERPFAQQTWLRNYEHQINLTLNYRRDADISFWRFNFPAHEGKKRGSYKLRIPLKEKQFSVVWPVSHCLTASKREQYVQELSKHIGVHIYGLCGNYTCQKLRWDSCFDMFEKTYKFYISFENAICQDYITEKTTSAMHYELIPIVLGGGDYKKTVPPGSYIDARDFAHPRDLAQYLSRLANNETDYVRYFQWKQEFGLGTRQDRWCVVCQAAHNKSLVQPAHHDYYNWWHQACDNELVPRMRQEAGW